MGVRGGHERQRREVRNAHILRAVDLEAGVDNTTLLPREHRAGPARVCPKRLVECPFDRRSKGSIVLTPHSTDEAPDKVCRNEDRPYKGRAIISDPNARTTEALLGRARGAWEQFALGDVLPRRGAGDLKDELGGVDEDLEVDLLPEVVRVDRGLDGGVGRGGVLRSGPFGQPCKLGDGEERTHDGPARERVAEDGEDADERSGLA